MFAIKMWCAEQEISEATSNYEHIISAERVFTLQNKITERLA